MAPKKNKTPVQEEEQPVAPPEPEEPEIPPEDAVTELETGLQLLLRPFDVKEIWSLSADFAAQEKRLAQLLGLEEAIPVANQRSIVCEFHLFNLMHAKTLCLGALQGAAFHAILARILDMMKIANATPATKPQEGCGPAQCFKEFERLLLAHSVEDPPQRLAVFQANEARLLTDYAASTLFKHFLLYQFCINFQQEAQTLRRTMSIQRPMAPLDLRQGLLRVDEAPVEEGDQQTPVEEREPTEEEEVDRIVQEKLRETEERLQKKLDSREEMLAAKLAEKNTKPSKAKKGK